MPIQAFIYDLVQMLARTNGGMVEFEEPLPEGVAEGLRRAVLAFGEQALPALHATLFDEYRSAHVIDVLASIAHPSSGQHLIEFHANRRDFITGAAAIQALRKLRTEQAYLYLAERLSSYAQGDQRAFETRNEAVVACEALAEWQDRRAIPALMLAQVVDDGGFGISEAARLALKHYDRAE